LRGVSISKFQKKWDPTNQNNKTDMPWFWKSKKKDKQGYYGDCPIPKFPPRRVGEIYHPGEAVPRMPEKSIIVTNVTK